MRAAERKLLTDLRQALVALHRTLLEWERAAYEREHGRTEPGVMLQLVVSDPQFAWLRPMTELIAVVDETLDSPSDASVDLDLLARRARHLMVPDEQGSSFAKRYHTALQEVPDVVFAHRRVVAALRDLPARETLH
jgi:hypothetical protein